MIECIFTIDYEIYGNGEGSLRKLVYEPAERLKATFNKWNAHFILFVEAAELEMIEAKGTDSTIDLVKEQIQNFYREGFEIGLHLHPQWYNSRYESGKWILDYSEYNLCTLPRERIVQIINRSIDYLRNLLCVTDFLPLSFRAGNWLFQPTRTLSEVLIEKGIKVDSSVFKGGLQHLHKLDYRRSLKNGYSWPFADEVNIPDPKGALVELPIYTKMAPIWKMLTSKRIGLQQKAPTGSHTRRERLLRYLDFLRFWYPLKFDFCRMTIDELTEMINIETQKDRRNSNIFRPIIAIGHTKDLNDLETVESLLSYLKRKDISLSTFKDIYDRCKC